MAKLHSALVIAAETEMASRRDGGQARADRCSGEHGPDLSAEVVM